MGKDSKAKPAAKGGADKGSKGAAKEDKKGGEKEAKGGAAVNVRHILCEKQSKSVIIGLFFDVIVPVY